MTPSHATSLEFERSKTSYYVNYLFSSMVVEEVAGKNKSIF